MMSVKKIVLASVAVHHAYALRRAEDAGTGLEPEKTPEGEPPAENHATTEVDQGVERTPGVEDDRNEVREEGPSIVEWIPGYSMLPSFNLGSICGWTTPEKEDAGSDTASVVGGEENKDDEAPAETPTDSTVVDPVAAEAPVLTPGDVGETGQQVDGAVDVVETGAEEAVSATAPVVHGQANKEDEAQTETTAAEAPVVIAAAEVTGETETAEKVAAPKEKQETQAALTQAAAGVIQAQADAKKPRLFKAKSVMNAIGLRANPDERLRIAQKDNQAAEERLEVLSNEAGEVSEVVTSAAAAGVENVGAGSPASK